MPSCLSFPGPVEPSQSKTKADTDGLPAVVVAFDDLQKYAPTAAGLYAVHGEIDLNYHVYRDHLEKMKLLTLRRSLFYFAVSPDKPFALRGKVVREAPRKRKKGVNAWSAEDARGSAWGASHHLGGVASGKQLFEKLLVRVEDAHGNVCDGVGGTVSAKIMGFTEKTGPTTVKTAPSLAAAEGEAATFELKQGCVEIPALSLGTNASHAPEGNYCLVISFPQGTAGSVTSVTLPFHYTDDNAKETLLQELAARKRDWVAYQQYLEKKLARHEGEKQKYYAVEAKWDARMREIQQEMLNTKRLKSPNWETFVAKDLSTQTGDALRKMEREAGAAEKAGKDAKGRRKYYFQDMHDGLKMVNDAKMQEGSGIIGVLAELGFVGDEQLDACLSKTLGRYMQTVLLEGETTLVDWKKRLRNLPPSQNLALLATDNVSRVQLDAEGKILHLQTPKPRPAGWVGYAANLVELADSNKYLRSVFFSLLGSKAVFDTIESARAWRREMLRHNGKPPPLICLDGEKMEQTGIEWAGQQLRDPGFRFGAMPVRLTEKYKAIKHLHNLLETYDELLAEKAAELAARPPLDPHNVQPRCHAKVQEVATKIKAMSKVLDQPLETVSTASLQGHLSDAVPEQSQVVSAQRDEAADGDQEKPCVKRKVPGGPKSAFDFDGESDSDEVPAITIKRPRGARAKKAN
ncbi:hypothetical protein DIPPA_22719 [Diplonema papillatum]|nr:hypothetical protein DIPPA_22719 [Diplonema papillatum]